jgi:hypothetical protein
MTLPETAAHSTVMLSLSKHDFARVFRNVMVRQAHHDTVAETLTHSTVMLSLSKHDHARDRGAFHCHAEPVEA